jgi:hypothetical protein
MICLHGGGIVVPLAHQPLVIRDGKWRRVRKLDVCRTCYERIRPQLEEAAEIRSRNEAFGVAG